MKVLITESQLRRLIKELHDNDGVNPKDVGSDVEAIKSVINNKRDLGFITVKLSDSISEDGFWSVVITHKLKVKRVEGNPYEAYIYYKPGAEDKADELKNIAEKYGGYLSAYATKEDTIRIGQLLGYGQKYIDDYIKNNYNEDGTVKEI